MRHWSRDAPAPKEGNGNVEGVPVAELTSVVREGTVDASRTLPEALIEAVGDSVGACVIVVVDVPLVDKVCVAESETLRVCEGVTEGDTD